MPRDNWFDLPPDAVLVDKRWPEPVRILRVDKFGDDHYTLHVVGTDSKRLYQPVLTGEELLELSTRIKSQTLLDSLAARFRFVTEGQRIHPAYLFDPLFAASVSKIDPLPHQLEAVYGYMLPQPALRFMLADDPGAGKTIMAGLLLKEPKHDAHSELAYDRDIRV